MKGRLRWSRRKFVQMAGSSLGAMSLGPSLLARSAWTTQKTAPRFAYVGFGGEDATSEGIAVFDVRDGQWKQTSKVLSRTPTSLALDASERFLYVVNEVDEHEGLPSGTVEAYAINTIDGSLTLLNRQRLSLSATRPRHAAISPDGHALVVAVHGGGAYNVLPLKQDGSLGPVAGILKETGSGPHKQQKSAHPQMVVFDRAGRVVSADLGSDRLSVLKLDAAQLSYTERYETHAGDGPHQITFHPDGRLLFVANGLDASVVCYSYDADSGTIVERLNKVPTARNENSGGVLMTIHPAGNFLYTAHPGTNDGVSVWSFERSTAELRMLQVADEDAPRLHQLTMTPDGSRLLGLSREDGSVLSWSVVDGHLGHVIRLSKLEAPLSLAFKST